MQLVAFLNIISCIYTYLSIQTVILHLYDMYIKWYLFINEQFFWHKIVLNSMKFMIYSIHLCFATTSLVFALWEILDYLKYIWGHFLHNYTIFKLIKFCRIVVAEKSVLAHQKSAFLHNFKVPFSSHFFIWYHLLLSENSNFLSTRT